MQRNSPWPMAVSGSRSTAPRVLDAALDLFADHGVSGTSLQMIADAHRLQSAPDRSLQRLTSWEANAIRDTDSFAQPLPCDGRGKPT
jgi:hypothetical protein